MSGEWESIASAAPGPISQEDTREIEESKEMKGERPGQNRSLKTISYHCEPVTVPDSLPHRG